MTNREANRIAVALAVSMAKTGVSEYSCKAALDVIAETRKTNAACLECYNGGLIAYRGTALSFPDYDKSQRGAQA